MVEAVWSALNFTAAWSIYWGTAAARCLVVTNVLLF